LTGIGRATVIAFAEEGARVAVSGRHSDKGEALVVELKEKGASGALFIKADVRNEAEVAAMVDAVVEKFGSLDIAVNNAGKETLGMVTDVTGEAFGEVFKTNVLGTLLERVRHFLSDLVSWHDEKTQALPNGCVGRRVVLRRSVPDLDEQGRTATPLRTA
jgi:NAD(P)-dependent dehydrogenase (short-subunit alcohol dehydrogenase family)